MTDIPTRDPYLAPLDAQNYAFSSYESCFDDVIGVLGHSQVEGRRCDATCVANDEFARTQDIDLCMCLAGAQSRETMAEIEAIQSTCLCFADPNFGPMCYEEEGNKCGIDAGYASSVIDTVADMWGMCDGASALTLGAASLIVLFSLN